MAMAAMAIAVPAAAAEPARSASVGEAPVVTEARAFMADYARDLSAGDRAAVARRYDRRGAWRMGHGEKGYDLWVEIARQYRENWPPPKSFAWRELSYEPLGPDAVVVLGLFDWGVSDEKSGGTKLLTYSYTGLLVRQDGELRIRMEDESGK